MSKVASAEIFRSITEMNNIKMSTIGRATLVVVQAQDTRVLYHDFFFGVLME